LKIVALLTYSCDLVKLWYCRLSHGEGAGLEKRNNIVSYHSDHPVLISSATPSVTAGEVLLPNFLVHFLLSWLATRNWASLALCSSSTNLLYS